MTQRCQVVGPATGHLVVMETTLRISNVVLFELPAYADVDELNTRIRPRWPGSQELVADVWLVTARVRRSKTDLAFLLREIEAYVGEAGLHAIRYRLDGRFYIMEAPALDRAASL
jgi:hypothetical protein